MHQLGPPGSILILRQGIISAMQTFGNSSCVPGVGINTQDNSFDSFASATAVSKPSTSAA
jgi:hypothetical protein